MEISSLPSAPNGVRQIQLSKLKKFGISISQAIPKSIGVRAESLGVRAESFGERFEQIVRQRPDRIAIAGNGQSLTYRETAELARRIGHRISVTSLSNEEPVAILMNHGPNAVTAIVGTVLYGHGYTPLDPNLPAGRLTQMIGLAGSTQILTDLANLDLARRVAGGSIEVQVFESVTAEPPVAVSDIPLVDPANALAALLFTSGSTGEPKAVAFPQTHLMRGADHFRTTAGLTPNDRVSLLTAFSYLPSTFCTFGPLLTGASVHPYNIGAQGIEGILGWIKKSRISVLLTVPTVFRRISEKIVAPAEVASVRHVQLAGEALLTSDVRLFRTLFPSWAKLFNDMGSTEAGCLARYRVDDNADLHSGVAPIGFPYHDTEVILRDEQGQEVRPGEPGEMFVRARHIARGYWRRPELSKERFFRDQNDPEMWIFRTGDLAVQRPDGSLVAMGRKDDQVKINGVRIEPAEVQAVLAEIPGVREALVIAPKGEGRLVAYVAGDTNALNASELRAAAAAVLPMVMTPSAFVIMDEIPTTVTGKVDRNALPAPDADGARSVDVATPSKGELSSNVFVSSVAVAFERILGVAQVRPNDDFFLLGGDSLNAVELMALIENNFNVRLPLSTMLEATTPRQIADRITVEVRSDSPHGVLHLSKASTASRDMTPIFCVPGAGGHALCYRHLIAALDVENPVYGLEYPGLNGDQQPLETVEAIADYFTAAIEATKPTGPVALIGHSVGGSVALEISRRLNAAGRATPVIAVLDALAPAAMRELNLALRARLIISYLLDPTQPDKFRNIFERGLHFLGKSVGKLLGRATTEPDWGREDPECILSAVRDSRISEVVAASMRAGCKYAPAPQRQSVVQFRSTDPMSLMMTQVDKYTQWESITCGGMREVTVPGRHDEVLQPPAVEIVATNISAMLRQASVEQMQRAESKTS